MRAEHVVLELRQLVHGERRAHPSAGWPISTVVPPVRVAANACAATAGFAERLERMIDAVGTIRRTAATDPRQTDRRVRRSEREASSRLLGDRVDGDDRQVAQTSRAAITVESPTPPHAKTATASRRAYARRAGRPRRTGQHAAAEQAGMSGIERSRDGDRRRRRDHGVRRERRDERKVMDVVLSDPNASRPVAEHAVVHAPGCVGAEVHAALRGRSGSARRPG